MTLVDTQVAGSRATQPHAALLVCINRFQVNIRRCIRTNVYMRTRYKVDDSYFLSLDFPRLTGMYYESSYQFKKYKRTLLKVTSRK